jgi:hypothetical protein
MNKAFVRDPDVTDPLCPACGSTGEAVDWETIAALVRADILAPAAPLTRDAAYYCPLATCDVAYFDGLNRKVGVESLIRPCYPKNAAAPICPCFGLTLDDIDRDLTEGAPTRTRAAVKRASTDEADCVHRNLSGRSCAADIQRYYVRRQMRDE